MKEIVNLSKTFEEDIYCSIFEKNMHKIILQIKVTVFVETLATGIL